MRTTMRTKQPLLVDDLIPLVLDANDHWWPCDLARLAAVSRAWRYYVHKRLYPCCSINTFGAATLLARTLAADPQLADLVFELHLQPVRVPLEQRPGPAEMRALRSLLGLPGLKRLMLGGELASKCHRFLKHVAYADEIESLHVDGRAMARGLAESGSLAWDESLSFAFPNLAKLELTDISLVVDPSSAPLPSLRSLVINNVHILSGYLSSLASEDLNHLHITTRDTESTDEQLRIVQTSCAVRCLHYELQKDACRSFIGLQVDDETLGSLRCLHLDGHCVDTGVLQTLAAQCRNLEELKVSGRAVRMSAQEWAGVIRSGAFDALRRLGVPPGTCIPPFVGWAAGELEEIETACAGRIRPISLL
ncbi:hypothetical protein D9619_003046 [Psilocybe cf. subviscida]|uniref:Uncharacterized protein n=1 Tax=Psilocybe cf. subviscida TaxID=2480587 RepID=A0A8H5AWR3_9AGAR|nr:hypothetical protein D9619_003046 [Psilocybe cf. subviscida]